MKRLVVLGAGESGVGTAILAKKKGFEVFVSDKSEIKDFYKFELEKFDIDFEGGGHTENKIFSADLVMKSPGIPDTVPLVNSLIEKGIEVISEIEFAYKYTEATLVGITGSNGKTTTTMLTHALLKNGHVNVGIAGNIGDSFAKQVAQDEYGVYVLELSSFQLDGIKDFKPHIAIITNITPDHLDRYNYDFNKYIDSKFSITKNQTEEDYLIYDSDDEVIVEWLKSNKVKAQLVPFSLEKELEFGAYLKEGNLEVKINEDIFKMESTELSLKGKHNLKNAMAASSVAKLMKMRNDRVSGALKDFEGVDHRLERVLKVNDVLYINDSKATNVNSVYYALECVEKPIIWIVGGVDKGNDYSDLMPLVREKVKAIICLGVDNSKIIDTFKNVVDEIVETQDMTQAVKFGYKLGEEGDSVLLSPACASFDLFDSYEDRGNQFKEAIKNL